jgi:hypothetical protein
MTTTIILYRLTSEPDELFAHCARSETFEINGIPVLNAETTFFASIPTNGSPETDRAAAKRFAIAEHRWPIKIPIVWDDTGERW